jgi:hypothetical protein
MRVCEREGGSAEDEDGARNVTNVVMWHDEVPLLPAFAAAAVSVDFLLGHRQR